MPLRLKKPCSYPMCPELTHDRYCGKHQKQVSRCCDKERGTAAKRGYGGRWQRYRIMFLRKNPLCAECQRQGRITPAKHVDHIKAVSGADDPLFWEPSNHQGLCHSCHSAKTMLESVRRG